MSGTVPDAGNVLMNIHGLAPEQYSQSSKKMDLQGITAQSGKCKGSCTEDIDSADRGSSELFLRAGCCLCHRVSDFELSHMDELKIGRPAKKDGPFRQREEHMQRNMGWNEGVTACSIICHSFEENKK